MKDYLTSGSLEPLVGNTPMPHWGLYGFTLPRLKVPLSLDPYEIFTDGSMM